MLWVVLATLAISSGITFGVVAGLARARGFTSGRNAAALLALAALVAGGFAYYALLETRRGSLPPDHFYNSVFGNILVVGGLIASVGAVLGIIAATVLVLRR